MVFWLKQLSQFFQWETFGFQNKEKDEQRRQQTHARVEPVKAKFQAFFLIFTQMLEKILSKIFLFLMGTRLLFPKSYKYIVNAA